MNTSQQYIEDTFMAFADTIIPRTPQLAEEYGRIQLYGAVDLSIHEYLIMSLNYTEVPLTEPIVLTLDIAAEQLGGSSFAALDYDGRLRALNLLLESDFDASLLPDPFTDNLAYEQYTIGYLIRLVYMGYYSKWSGYGSTRLAPPNQRSLEHFPVSWQQIGYPGPSLGYRAELESQYATYSGERGIE